MTDQPSTAILVLGMHRSGTSAVTRVLNLLGVELGSDLLGPGYSNEQGFWEHREAYAIDDRLLVRLGRTWHDVRDLPANWRTHPATLRAKAEIVELVGREFAASPLWAIKDPRICRLTALWVEALRECGQAPRALIVVRDPFEVAESLRVRDGWAPAQSILLWVQHLLDAERASRHLPRSLVFYDGLLADWRGSVARFARELVVDWPVAIEAAAGAIEAYLDPAEKHHRKPACEGQPMSGFLAALLAACRQAAEGDAEGWQALARLGDEFAAVAGLYAGAIEDLTARLDGAEKRARDAETWLNAARPAVEAATAAASDIHKVGESLRLQGEVAQRLEHQLKLADAALWEANETRARLEADLTQHAAELAERNAALADAEARWNAFRDGVETKRRAYEAAVEADLQRLEAADAVRVSLEIALQAKDERLRELLAECEALRVALAQTRQADGASRADRSRRGGSSAMQDGAPVARGGQDG